MIRETKNHRNSPVLTSDHWHVLRARWNGDSSGEPLYQRTIESEHDDSASAADAARTLVATFVTDKSVGSYDYKKWSVAGATAKPEAGYSVIELYLDAAGNGTGTLSLAADVVVDAATNTVSLASGGTSVLTQVRRQPAA